MSEVCNTVKVKSTHPETQGAFVEINEEDFNEAVHELYVEGSEEPAPVEKKLTKAEAEAAKAEAAKAEAAKAEAAKAEAEAEAAKAAKAKAEAEAAAEATKANENQAGWGKQ